MRRLDDDFAGRALPLPDQPGAGHRAIVGPATTHLRLATIELLAKLFEVFHGAGLQPTKRQFLQAIGEPVLQKAPVERGRFAGEHVAPQLLQFASRGGSEGHHPGQYVGHAKSCRRRRKTGANQAT